MRVLPLAAAMAVGATAVGVRVGVAATFVGCGVRVGATVVGVRVAVAAGGGDVGVTVPAVTLSSWLTDVMLAPLPAQAEEAARAKLPRLLLMKSGSPVTVPLSLTLPLRLPVLYRQLLVKPVLPLPVGR